MQIINETSIVKQQILKDNLICHQTVTNGNITEQYWITKDLKKSHPLAYKSEEMRFYYFGDDAFSNIDFPINFEYEPGTKEYDLVSPEPKIVDVKSFNNYNKLFSNWFGMDGDIYSIMDESPISFWRAYIPQTEMTHLSEKFYNLEELANYLESMLFYFRNIQIADAPTWYDKKHYGQKILYFEYKFQRDSILKIKRETGLNPCGGYIDGAIAAGVLNLKQFLKKGV